MSAARLTMNKTLGFLRCNMKTTNERLRNSACNAFVKPVLEYASPSQPVTSKRWDWECLQTGTEAARRAKQDYRRSVCLDTMVHAKASALANPRSWRTVEKINQSQNLRVRHLEVSPQSQLSSTSGQNPDTHQPIALGEPPNMYPWPHIWYAIPFYWTAYYETGRLSFHGPFQSGKAFLKKWPQHLPLAPMRSGSASF